MSRLSDCAYHPVMILKPGSFIFIIFYSALGAALGFGLAVLFDNLHFVESWLANTVLCC